MRVALHVVAGSLGGPRTYGFALARELHRRSDVDLVVLTDGPETFGDIETIALPRSRPWADHVTIPRVLRRLRPDVYHDTKNALPRRLPCPGVVTIHDLAYVHFPRTFSRAARVYLKYHTEQAARRAARIVTVSEHARSDLERTLGVHPERVRVAYNGVDDSFRVPNLPRPEGLPRPYVLSVGTIQARKNLDVLVAAVAALRERNGVDCDLVIAGRRGWKTTEFDRALQTTPVRLLGVVPDADLPGLYAHATAFVQPSSYEGFGLTAAEAMAAGTPTICADGGSLAEVVGDAALLVPPRDVEALRGALARLFGEPQVAARLREAGPRQAAGYTWSRSAEAHASVYAELCGAEALA